MRRRYSIGLLLCLFSLQASRAIGADPQPQLGKRGQQLLSEKFEGSELPKGWNRNTGDMQLKDGTLKLSERAADKHIGAFRCALPMKDMLIQLDFQFDGAKMFHLGFDPAPGQLEKKGHLYNVVITPTKWSLVENNDKAKPDSKPKVHAQDKLALEPNKWYTLTLENKGEEIVATISGAGTLRAKASDFKVKKPALVFRAGGEDTASVRIDNLSVYALE